jgi:IS30 family transposase
LRQYFPKGTDLRPHTPQQLADVAAELNERPRKTLGWASPVTVLTRLVEASVAPVC